MDLWRVDNHAILINEASMMDVNIRPVVDMDRPLDHWAFCVHISVTGIDNSRQSSAHDLHVLTQDTSVRFPSPTAFFVRTIDYLGIELCAKNGGTLAQVTVVIICGREGYQCGFCCLLDGLRDRSSLLRVLVGFRWC